LVGGQVGPAICKPWTAKLDPQVANPELGRHSPRRGRMLAETFPQRGNREVTNKQFADRSFMLCS
jgi:hypothetical protein